MTDGLCTIRGVLGEKFERFRRVSVVVTGTGHKRIMEAKDQGPFEVSGLSQGQHQVSVLWEGHGEVGLWLDRIDLDTGEDYDLGELRCREGQPVTIRVGVRDTSGRIGDAVPVERLTCEVSVADPAGNEAPEVQMCGGDEILCWGLQRTPGDWTTTAHPYYAEVDSLESNYRVELLEPEYRGPIHAGQNIELWFDFVPKTEEPNP